MENRNAGARLAPAAVFALMIAACSVGPADMHTLRESRPIGSAKEFDVHLKYDVGRLEIAKIPGGELFSFDLDYDRRRFEPKFNFDGAGDRASLRLDMDKISDLGFGDEENHLTLRLTERIPIDLDVSAGVSESQLDLSDLKIRRLRLHGGVGKTEVAFNRAVAEPVKEIEVDSGVGELTIRGLGNAQVERFDLAGGVGSAELDFTGEAAAMRNETNIKVGVGEIRLLVPRDANVEIHGESGFLSNIDAPSFERNGQTYVHRGGNDELKIFIRVESGVGQVSVNLK